MYGISLIWVCLNLRLVFSAFSVKSNHFVAYPSLAGIGDIVSEEHGVSDLSCATTCAVHKECTSANYSPTKNICTLLHVQDELDDWQDSQDHIYISENKPQDFTASVGFWRLIDEAENLRNKSAVVTTYNTPFVPAVPGGSTNVISFLGDKDSYVLLENNGHLAVTSFTWAAKVYPQSSDGPLFNWYLSSRQCEYHGPHIWLAAARLLFAACNGISLSGATHGVEMDMNTWHELAVSYNAISGAVQLRVDHITESFHVGESRSGHTAGVVVMGSRYYYSGTKYDARAFQGKMACVRLWAVVRDINNLRMDSPMCQMDV